MYYYIVDPQTSSQAQFERVQNQLYSSVSEFRIGGEMVRATGLRTIAQLVENAFMREAKTIIAVGNDDTFNQIVDAVGERDVTVGFIPLFTSEIADILGIKDIPQAVKTLAARRVEAMDLGVANHNLFFTKLFFGINEPEQKKFYNFQYIAQISDQPEIEIQFTADDEFRGSLKVIGGVIVNARSYPGPKISDPTDGRLDILLINHLTRWQFFKYRNEIAAGALEQIPGSSVIHAKKIELVAPSGMGLKLNNKVMAKTPVVIETRNKKLNVIVGKDRKF